MAVPRNNEEPACSRHIGRRANVPRHKSPGRSDLVPSRHTDRGLVRRQANRPPRIRQIPSTKDHEANAEQTGNRPKFHTWPLLITCDLGPAPAAVQGANGQRRSPFSRTGLREFWLKKATSSPQPCRPDQCWLSSSSWPFSFRPLPTSEPRALRRPGRPIPGSPTRRRRPGAGGGG